MNSLTRPSLFLAILTSSIGSPAATIYSVTSLGGFGGANSVATAINETGVAAGWASTPYGENKAFVSSGPGLQPLGNASQANGINASGRVVGTTQGPGGAQGTVWDGTGQSTVGGLGGTTSYATAVNNRGVVVGAANRLDGSTHAFLQDGQITRDLGTLDDGWSSAYGISNSDQVVGYGFSGGNARAFSWTSDKGMQQLGTLGGGQSWAFGINDLGQIVGHSTVVSGYDHAFLYQATGKSSSTMQDLGTLGGGNSYAYNINSSGQVVGYSYDAAGDSRAFVWAAGALFDLNSLIAADSGWLLTAAYGINESGQIVGSGTYNGQAAAFRLNLLSTSDLTLPGRSAIVGDPVPEPATIGTVAGAFLCIVCLRRFKT